MITKAQLHQLGLFDAKVPRYTSYPTAPHFSDAVTAPQHARWLKDIPEGSGISLYLHIPFCKRLCWFCACRTQGTQKMQPVQAYLQTLKAELRLLQQHLPQGIHLSRLHWGGGTPTLLSAQMMSELIEAIRQVAPFDEHTEFSVEIDPNEIDIARLDALADAGMTRASIGVQDFDPEIQKSIGRQQSYEDTRWAVEEIRARGVASLNTDILFGLPHQTPTKMAESVEKLLSLSPDRVALYGYAHVPWMAKRQQLIPSDSLPTPEERLELFDVARKIFKWDHFEEIGIDHFATRQDGLSLAHNIGRLRRNFQGYTDDTADVLIGVGASAISKFPQGYTQNAAATGAYTAAIRKGSYATSRGHVLDGEDTLRGRMIEQLMCEFRIDRCEMLQSFNVTSDTLNQILVQTGQAFEGLLTLNDAGLFVPPEARPLTRMIARSLDAYDLSLAGHSSAI
ncbi:oxygen-independent coproporphyrinogen III oxidase [Roseovarius sp. EL26]|uniref:oxygen-independent coproporphyrinogen III oxidase n=1 Tax=Roseovarius sp. EL26 TaxID=2126672 RepID=UPI000EA2C5E6|nr:oxygen-independent coproporphyrinogen III oxidase [Roseovarius sp. EL26]